MNLVAGLRKLDFSISDIVTMRDEPGRIPEILENYREKTATDLEFRTGVLERLKQVDPNSISSIRELGEYLKGIAEKRPLPASDVELQFYRIDGLTRSACRQSGHISVGKGRYPGYAGRNARRPDRKSKKPYSIKTRSGCWACKSLFSLAVHLPGKPVHTNNNCR